MAGDVFLRDGSAWSMRSSVFYWVIDELAGLVFSSELARTLREISEVNLGILAVEDLPPDQRADFVAAVRALPAVAAATLPQTPGRQAVIAQVQELADLVAASERE
ncbi:MAG: hypothetical protein JWM64_411 [Frankiales bacterium]|nr:hypothetical protein [Frankiales bacterium]